MSPKIIAFPSNLPRFHFEEEKSYSDKYVSGSVCAEAEKTSWCEKLSERDKAQLNNIFFLVPRSGLIHFKLDKYILKLDKYISKFKQIHFKVKINT